MQDFKKLNIWNIAIELANEIYVATQKFPETEKFGLTSQIRRAVISISSNIAEGAGRNSAKEFKYFITIAQGSCFELISQMTLAEKLKFIDENEVRQVVSKLESLSKMLTVFSQRLVPTTNN